jgi:hypothetical protein
MQRHYSVKTHGRNKWHGVFLTIREVGPGTLAVDIATYKLSERDEANKTVDLMNRAYRTGYADARPKKAGMWYHPSATDTHASATDTHDSP